jgi:hypothetical protein
MMRRFLPWELVLAVACCCPWHAAAQSPTIIAPDAVPIGGLCIVRVEGLAADAKFSWLAIPDVQTADLMERDGSPVLFVATDKAGTFHVVLAYIDGGEVRQKMAKVVVGTPGPTPPAPNPPGPTPVPPNPEGFRVLILEETADRPSLPRSQLAILMSQEVRNYLNAKEPDSWRILDDDLTSQHMTGWPDGWKQTYAKAKELSAGRVPFVVVSNATSGEAVPLPATVADMLTLLRRYGG